MHTKINKLSYYMLLVALSVFAAVGLASSITMLSNISLHMDYMIFVTPSLADIMESMRTIVISTAVLSLFFSLGLNGMFIAFLVLHRKRGGQGRYLIVILVFEVFSVIGFVISIVGMARAFQDYYTTAAFMSILVPDLIYLIIGFVATAAAITAIAIHLRQRSKSGFSTPYNPASNPYATNYTPKPQQDTPPDDPPSNSTVKDPFEQ